MNHHNLFLIGYRCTGKTSVGKRLATFLDRAFVDTDSVIVSDAGMDIRKIVAHHGWQEFRRLEHLALQQVCLSDRQIVATGGGIVLDGTNVELMKNTGQVIWLKATPDTIRRRMLMDQASEGSRPALTSKDSIAEIEGTLAERKPLYRQAMDFAVDTDNFRLDEIVNNIINI
ncbi:MAG: shikimate kinase [Desulfobacterales bacterium]